MRIALGKRIKLFPGRDLSDPDILGRDQLIVIEDRNLEGVATDVDNRCPCLNDFLEGVRVQRDGLVVEKPLLGIG